MYASVATLEDNFISSLGEGGGEILSLFKVQVKQLMRDAVPVRYDVKLD